MSRTSYAAIRLALRQIRRWGGALPPTTAKPSAAPSRRVYGLPRSGRVGRDGNFVRAVRPPRPKEAEIVPRVPKLPPGGPAIVPRPLKSVPPSGQGQTKQAAAGGGGAAGSNAGKAAGRSAAEGGASSSSSTSSGSSGSSSSSSAYFTSEWFKQNGPILVLNFGSVCTLVGFTRHDVLELRVLSMTGSICSVVYFALSRPAFAPMAWSSLFALTNAVKIARIIDERKGQVVLEEREEDIYAEHFMAHGLTPKQFAKVLKKATTVTVKKGEKIVTAGERLDRVYLVVEGHTRASFLGRKVTAASSAPGNNQSLRGGDAGAWIGEIAFLEMFWSHETRKKKSAKEGVAKSASHDGKGGADKGTEAGDKGKEETARRDDVDKEMEESENSIRENNNAGCALHTIVAKDDCELLSWCHTDLEDLMHKSPDLRSAMTRSMTAAVVGKVVNFTVSRSTALPTWSTWLDDWKHSGGAEVHVKASMSNAEKTSIAASKVVREQIVGQ